MYNLDTHTYYIHICVKMTSQCVIIIISVESLIRVYWFKIIFHFPPRPFCVTWGNETCNFDAFFCYSSVP